MNRKMHIAVAALALLLPSLALAQETVPANEVFPFLAQPRSAALAGTAGAGSASTGASAAMAAFDNPAMLAFAPARLDAALSYGRWAPASRNTLSNNLGAGVAVRLAQRFALSAGAVMQLRPQQDFGPTYGTYSPKDWMIGLAASFAFSEHVSLGVNGRYVRQQLMQDYAIGSAAFSAMVQYRLKGLNVAAGVANFGGGVKSENGKTAPLPASARIAADYEFTLGPGKMGAALDGDYYFSGKLGVSAGLRYAFRDVLFARAGYRFASAGAALPSHLALGLGAKFRGICLDVTYITANRTIGNSLAVSLGYRF